MISLAGGEPFIRHDMIEIVSALAEQHFPFVTTNGWCITPELARQVFAAGLGGVSVSMQYPDEGKDDPKRGMPGRCAPGVRGVQRRNAVGLLADQAAGVGYMLKQPVLDVPAFCRDLRRVTHGGTALDPEVVALMMTRSLRDDEALDSLTPRRREVLALIREEVKP